MKSRSLAHGRQLACPACGGDAEVIVSGSIEYDRCRACGGVWLDRGELEQLLAIAYRTGKAKAAGLSVTGGQRGEALSG